MTEKAENKPDVEIIDSIRRGISIHVPVADVDAAFKSAIDKVKKEAKLPGFRQGKVPDNVILQRFSREVEAEAVQEAIRISYPRAVTEASLAPLSDPRIEPAAPLKKGEPFNYRAVFEIYPEIKVKGYEGLSLAREQVDVTEDEIEGELIRLQRQMTQLEPAPEGRIGLGTLAMIDFKGTAGGKTFEGSQAENYVVDFGSGNLLEQFETEIEGMTAGEEKKISFHYPTDFYRREIAGKKGEFTVNVKEVRRKVAPELDDAFAKELGDFKTLGDVKAEIKKRIAEYKEGLARSNLREQAIRALIEKNGEFEAPTALIDAELGNMLDQLKRNAQMRGTKFDPAKVDSREFVKNNIKEATARARGYMLVRAITEAEKVEVSGEEIEERVGRIAADSRKGTDEIREHLNKNNMMESLRSQMLFEKTLDLVVDKAKIKTEKPDKKKG